MNHKSSPRVVLSHSGIQHTYQPAKALQELGMLEKFYGTLCYHEDHLLMKWLGKLFGELKRRDYSNLNIERIDIHPWPEIKARLARLTGGRNYFTNNVIQHRQCREFDSYVSAKLDRLSFDVFIGLSGSTLRSLKRAKQLGKIAVLDQHDIHYQLAAQLLSEEISAFPKLKHMISYWPPYQPYLDVLKAEMELADYILVPSTFALESHVAAGISKEKLVLMLHAIKPEHAIEYKRRSSGNRLRIIFVGTISPRKGIQYLLEAIKQLNQRNIELTLVGDSGGDLTFLAPYQAYFKRIDYVPHGQLKFYIEQSDVLVLPTIYDAFGLSALEAMAAGRPVIVSEYCAAGSDVVRDGTDGYVIPIRNVEMLKDRLMRLYRNEELREIMGRNARERVKTFNWQSYRNKLSEFLLRSVILRPKAEESTTSDPSLRSG